MAGVISERPVTEMLSTRREIVEALEAAHEAALDYWSQYELTTFFSPMGEHWPASDHLRHLTRSMTPLLPVLRVPRLALRVAFGSPEQPSRSIEAIGTLYAAALRSGATAGRYTPRPDGSAHDQIRRDSIMDAHSETLRGLTQAMERWSEAQLDTHQLPHPLLGRLTVREMMLFTLLHNRHHVAVAEQRRVASATHFD